MPVNSGVSRPAPLFEELTFIVDAEPHSAAVNMAVDEVLLEQVRAPVLRWYHWARPALSFGYFGRYEEIEASSAGREMVRRWTGGGTVPHGDDFTFSVIVPRTHAAAQLPASEAYRRIHAAVAFALDGSALAEAAAAKVSQACFENPVASDVLLDGRKIAGGAQRRTGAGLLHQGSVQKPGLGEAFARVLGELLGVTCRSHLLAASILIAAEELAQRRYAADAWLMRY